MCHILAAAYRVKAEKNWRKIDFSSPNKNEQIVEMLQEIRHALEDVRLLLPKKIFFSEECDANLVGFVCALQPLKLSFLCLPCVMDYSTYLRHFRSPR